MCPSFPMSRLRRSTPMVALRSSRLSSEPRSASSSSVSGVTFGFRLSSSLFLRSVSLTAERSAVARRKSRSSSRRLPGALSEANINP